MLQFNKYFKAIKNSHILNKEKSQILMKSNGARIKINMKN